MFGMKSAKDRLIEMQSAEIARLTGESGELRESLLKCDAAFAELVKKAAELEETLERRESRKAGSRTMSDRCKRLSERSYELARKRDPGRNLVAELPPPGAAGPARPAAFEGPG